MNRIVEVQPASLILAQRGHGDDRAVSSLSNGLRRPGLELGDDLQFYQIVQGILYMINKAFFLNRSMEFFGRKFEDNSKISKRPFK